MNTPLALGCALAVILAAACASSAPPTTPSPSPTPTATPTAAPTPTPSPSPTQTVTSGTMQLQSEGALSTGTYLYDNSLFTPVAFTFTVPDGWVVQNGGWNVSKNVDQPDELQFASSVVSNIYADGCVGSDARRSRLARASTIWWPRYQNRPARPSKVRST